MFLTSWETVGRSAVVAVAAYAALMLVLRVSGKRTLAQLNAFDFVVTVAFGSCLASALVDQAVSVAEAGVAFVALAALQAVVAGLAARSRRIRAAVTARPLALVVDGEVRRDVMHRERVAEGDLREVIRSKGLADLGEVRAVVLESNGTLSVIPRSAGEGWALEDVDGLRSRG